MAKDIKRKRFYSTYRYNFRTKQKLDALKNSGHFSDYTEIIDIGIDFLYELIILKKIPEFPELYEIVAKKTEEEE